MEEPRLIKRALLSVSDKTDIVALAKILHELNIELLSTGGTATLLKEHQIPVIDVADYTGYPEMMDGRVKTLHPKVHGGILARRGIDDAVLAAHEIKTIDLVVVNLYPFCDTVAKKECTYALAVENIDIGGPTMIRSAAKNHYDVTVVVAPDDYQKLIDELKQHQGQISLRSRKQFALTAFSHTAQYDAYISSYLQQQLVKQQQTNDDPFPQRLSMPFIKKQTLRYGENSHQQAAFYIEQNPQSGSIASAVQCQGKELSYNNIADTDAALECVKSFDEPACVIVKHANPCGVAVAETILQAYQCAYQTDPTSAFGGIIAFNRELDVDTAQAIVAQQFVEVIIAPSISTDALAITEQKKNIRVLTTGAWPKEPQTQLDFKRVTSGLLLQDRDDHQLTRDQLVVVTKVQPTTQQIDDALFCWTVAKFVKSNAIVYAKNKMTIGIGAGQMSRVYSAKIAGIKADDEGLQVAGSVMASDAFFPFRDGIDAAAQSGISCVIQPGGSMRDQEVIDAANEHGIAMIFTQVRHFRH